MKAYFDLSEITNEFKAIIEQVVEAKLEEQYARLTGILQHKEEKYFTIQELSSTLQFERQSIYKWIKSGKLIPTKVKNKIRIKESDLNKFLTSYPRYSLKKTAA